jgi:hypothetical protein
MTRQQHGAEPVTLGNIRARGCRYLLVYCTRWMCVYVFRRMASGPPLLVAAIACMTTKRRHHREHATNAALRWSCCARFQPWPNFRCSGITDASNASS